MIIVVFSFITAISITISLAIGKEGQNARLAARLTGFKIDIKSETQAREAGDFMDYEEDYEDDALTEDELNLDEDFEDTAYDEPAEDESYEYEEDEFAGEEDSEND